MATRHSAKNNDIGAVLTPREMTDYCVRHRIRQWWGVLEEEEIKQTISYAADYWRLEKIKLSRFGHVADPDYPNRSMRAHPIVHFFNSYKGESICDVLDGLHRIGMARAKKKRTILAWVGHLETEASTNANCSVRLSSARRRRAAPA